MHRLTLTIGSRRQALFGAAASVALAWAGGAARAQVVAPTFAGSYALTNLGAVAGVPTSYGGLTFKYDDPNTLLLGGNANTSNALVYSVGVMRDANNHVTGFTGTPTNFAPGSAGSGGIDGGLAYGPGGVLFYTSFSDNHIGQVLPTNTGPAHGGPDKVIDAGSLGVSSSVGTLAFVPAGFANAGHLKIASYNGDTFYDATISPDGGGTFNISSATLGASGISGPEGIVFVTAGNAQFAVNSVLLSEYKSNRVSAYDLDANSNPIVGTRRDFITGLSGAEGGVIDPLTGDFLFSTFGSSNRIIRVSGFTAPAQTVPEPSAFALLGAGGLMGGLLLRRKRRG